jgi:O-acetyl-ADP-ribose deacetylase (regulator of RNase III)
MTSKRDNGVDSRGVTVKKTFVLPGTNNAVLCVSAGSVVNFRGDAIVNAANEGCLGGGGVDGAISQAGGARLRRAREALPLVPGRPGVRCPVGEARLTVGGDLEASYCIHAVGPDYNEFGCYDGFAKVDALLGNAYKASMKCAREQKLETVAFSLLSAGIFKGRRSLNAVLTLGVEAIANSGYPGLKEVHLVGFTNEEIFELVKVCDTVFAATRPVGGDYTAGAGSFEKHRLVAGDRAQRDCGPQRDVALHAWDETRAATIPPGRPLTNECNLPDWRAKLDFADSGRAYHLTARPSVSRGAEQLIKAQQTTLPKIIRDVQMAGIQTYVKQDHWAWYMWPTTKEGNCDHLQVVVRNADDVAFVMAGPTVAQWTEALGLLTQVLTAQKTCRVFPTIDHDRIDYFIKEWSSAEYRAAMRLAPKFAAAVGRFASAWDEAKAAATILPRLPLTSERNLLDWRASHFADQKTFFETYRSLGA